MTKNIKTKNLKWFVKNRKNIVMPNIQRDFVWTKEQVENLFDSIYQGFFIGIFWLWENPEELDKIGYWNIPTNFSTKFEKTEIIVWDSKNKMAIIDGQQRLSALSIGLFGSYNGNYLYFNTQNGSFKFKSEIANTNAESSVWKRVVDIYHGINKKYQRTTKAEKKFKDRLNKLTILTLVLEDNMENITEIFKRVNKSGTPLSSNQILLAELIKSWKSKKARTEIDSLRKELKTKYDIRIDYNFIIQSCMFLLDKPITKHANKHIRDSKQTVEDIKNNWGKLKESILLMGKTISNYKFSDYNISSLNALIPVAYLIYKKRKDEFNNQNLISRYLYSSFLKNTGSLGSSGLVSIQKKLKDSKLEDLLEDEKFKMKEKDYERVLEYKKGKKARVVLSILYKGIDKTTDVDHMHPFTLFERKKAKETLKKQGASNKQINSFIKEIEKMKEKGDQVPNLEPLSIRNNRQKNKMPLKKWVEEELHKNGKRFDRKKHFLNKDTSLLFIDFKEFYKVRKDNMKKKLKDFFSGKKKEFDAI